MLWVEISPKLEQTFSKENSNLPTNNILKEVRNRYELFKTPELQNLARIESSLLKGARKYFDDKGFIEVIVPHITRATGACENISTMFSVDFFGERSYLAQTGQLYLETLTPFLKKVCCVGPSFRAEPDADERHLTEFPLLEIEFEGDFKQLMAHIEGIIFSMISTAWKERREELEFFGIDKNYISKFKPPYRKVTYTEALNYLTDGYKLNWGDDIKSMHEKHLLNAFGQEPFFLTHWPKPIKFFNMRANDHDSSIVNSADLILPFGGEAVGAAERESTYEALLERLKQSNMLRMLEERGGSIEDFRWYLDFYKKYGGTLHSGCGIGMNRVTQALIASNDIRACTVFPMNRVSLL